MIFSVAYEFMKLDAPITGRDSIIAIFVSKLKRAEIVNRIVLKISFKYNCAHMHALFA